MIIDTASLTDMLSSFGFDVREERSAKGVHLRMVDRESGEALAEASGNTLPEAFEALGQAIDAALPGAV